MKRHKIEFHPLLYGRPQLLARLDEMSGNGWQICRLWAGVVVYEKRDNERNRHQMELLGGKVLPDTEAQRLDRDDRIAFYGEMGARLAAHDAEWYVFATPWNRPPLELYTDEQSRAAYMRWRVRKFLTWVLLLVILLLVWIRVVPGFLDQVRALPGTQFFWYALFCLNVALAACLAFFVISEGISLIQAARDSRKRR